MSVGTAAIMVSIICSFTGEKDSVGILIRMVCGLFLAVVTIRPVANLNYGWLEGFAEGFDEMANHATAAGISMADDARREIITEETEAYILDIASSYNLHLQIEVALAQGDVPVPESVYLSGPAAPAAKEKLQTKIARELGIPKERQVWTG